MSDELIELANQLFDLAREGETARLAAYIEAGAPVDMRNANGDTFLILAAYHDAPDTVAMLIASGADLEAENERGQRALTCAVFKKDVASARHLIEAGADPDAGTPTARETAKMFGVAEIEALLS
ncbi:MAG: ankyrin repeat domain-containing protein [Propionibacterium sp.]|nr:ankyrin repeat domain-containing protein [Propionibacterium sp.]